MTLASFPAKLVINQDSIVDDVRIGSILKAQLVNGDLDSVAALQVWLLVQRHLGSQSEYAPYIASLPKPDVPIIYSNDMLRELAGTEVHAAVQDLRLKLQKTWQNVQPILHEVGIACDADLSSLSLDDWIWAFTILTSRSFNIPQGQEGAESTMMSLIPGVCRSSWTLVCSQAVQLFVWLPQLPTISTQHLIRSSKLRSVVWCRA